MQPLSKEECADNLAQLDAIEARFSMPSREEVEIKISSVVNEKNGRQFVAGVDSLIADVCEDSRRYQSAAFALWQHHYFESLYKVLELKPLYKGWRRMVPGAMKRAVGNVLRRLEADEPTVGPDWDKGPNAEKAAEIYTEAKGMFALSQGVITRKQAFLEKEGEVARVYRDVLIDLLLDERGSVLREKNRNHYSLLQAVVSTFDSAAQEGAAGAKLVPEAERPALSEQKPGVASSDPTVPHA